MREKDYRFVLFKRVKLLKFCDHSNVEYNFIFISSSLVRGRQLSMMTVNLYKCIHLYDKAPARKYIRMFEQYVIQC